MNELVKLTFQASVSASNNLSLAFDDEPVYREVSDNAANELTSDYVSGTIVVNPVPSLRIWAADQGIGLAWPSWATNFVLQQTLTDFTSQAGMLLHKDLITSSAFSSWLSLPSCTAWGDHSTKTSGKIP